MSWRHVILPSGSALGRRFEFFFRPPHPRRPASTRRLALMRLRVALPAAKNDRRRREGDESVGVVGPEDASSPEEVAWHVAGVTASEFGVEGASGLRPLATAASCFASTVSSQLTSLHSSTMTSAAAILSLRRRSGERRCARGDGFTQWQRGATKAEERARKNERKKGEEWPKGESNNGGKIFWINQNKIITSCLRSSCFN